MNKVDEGPYKDVCVCMGVCVVSLEEQGTDSAPLDMACSRSDLRLFTTAQIKIIIWRNLLNWVKDIMGFVLVETDEQQG